MFFKKNNPAIAEKFTMQEQIDNLRIRLGALEAELFTTHDKIDKLEVRTRKDKSQRPQESEESQKKGVFLRPDGSFINT